MLGFHGTQFTPSEMLFFPYQSCRCRDVTPWPRGQKTTMVWKCPTWLRNSRILSPDDFSRNSFLWGFIYLFITWKKRMSKRSHSSGEHHWVSAGVFLLMASSNYFWRWHFLLFSPLGEPSIIQHGHRKNTGVKVIHEKLTGVSLGHEFVIFLL